MKTKAKSKKAPTPPARPAWANVAAPVKPSSPPPPPPKAHFGGEEALQKVLKMLPAQPPGATYVEYSRDPIYKDGVMVEPGLTVAVPAACAGDFSSAKPGRVRWGKLRYGEDFVPLGADGNPVENPVEWTDKRPPEAHPSAAEPTTASPAKVAGPKREGVCAFIDGLIMEGGRTAEQVLAIVLDKFPGRDAKATLATVKTRPSHIKAKGQTPPPFLK